MSDLLDVRGLVTSFDTASGWIRAVDDVSLIVGKGKTVGLVGESGCGKTVTAMSILDLLEKPAGHILEGEILFKGEDLRKVSAKRMREVRGGEIGVVFQDSREILNPSHRIGKQLINAIRLHRKISRKQAKMRALELLDAVGIPDPRRMLVSFPYQLSDGMRQRVMIANALSCDPDLLIADEPAMSLDVTVQAQILDLIDSLKEKFEMGVLLITHDLGVVAQHCDDVVVMYAGRIVEHGSTRRVYSDPKHAYSKGLLFSMPRLTNVCKHYFQTIPGHPIANENLVSGCRFCQRMDRDKSVLLRTRPEYLEVWGDHWVEVCPECYKG